MLEQSYKIIINPVNGCNYGCTYCNCPRKFICTDVIPDYTLSPTRLYFALLDVLQDNLTENVTFEFSGGEPTILESTQIIQYIKIVEKIVNKFNIPNPEISILSNLSRPIDYFNTIQQNTKLLMNLTYSYHSEFEDIVNFIEKGNEAQRLIPSANVKMKIPNTVSIPHTITDLDNIVKFKINDDIDKPNIDNALMYDRIFEISYRGASTEITDQIC